MSVSGALTGKNQVAAERERFKLDVERRDFVARTEVNQSFTKYFALVRRSIYKAFEFDLPPRQEGLSAIEIKKMNRRRLDEILRGLPLLIDIEGKV